VNNLDLGFQNGSVAEDAISNYSNKNQNKRDRLRDFLTSKGVPSMVYYPLPLHQQKAYFQFVSTPIAEQICNEVVSLPICPELTPEYQEYIINTVREFFI
jgi:dTDP-4-amino-4,6-dideoxygalactose transaminase